jgi:hypothetical protein
VCAPPGIEPRTCRLRVRLSASTAHQRRPPKHRLTCENALNELADIRGIPGPSRGVREQLGNSVEPQKTRDGAVDRARYRCAWPCCSGPLGFPTHRPTRAGCRESAVTLSAISEARPLASLQTDEQHRRLSAWVYPVFLLRMRSGRPNRPTGRRASSGSGPKRAFLGRTIGHTGADAWQQQPLLRRC